MTSISLEVLNNNYLKTNEREMRRATAMIYIHFSMRRSQLPICQALLLTDITSIIQWSIANDMVLHKDKFVVVNYCLSVWHSLRELPSHVEKRLR